MVEKNWKKVVDLCSQLHKVVIKIVEKSRAEYFRNRRKTMKQFNVMLSKEKIEALEKKIKEQGKTKVEWFTEKVDEELSQKK